jgi:2-haloacid dehalogenase
MPRICVFDVNETLLDLSALDPHFERVFGDSSMRRTWFAQLLQSAFVSTIAGPYNSFGNIGATSLDMIAARQGRVLSPEERSSILREMQRLPPHPDVPGGLERLHNAGLRLVALTNSTEQVANAQLTNAGLSHFFEHIFSADTVHRLKPAPEPYSMVSTYMKVSIGELRLIAAHSWDIAGAMRAGCAAAFIARPGMVLDPLFTPPDVIGPNLYEVAEHIIEREK